MTKPKLRIGLIGTGFMGKAHVFGFASAPRVFDLPYEIDLHTVVDITPEAAAKAARTLGFAHSSANWRDLIANPEIDVVDITAPNALHKEMALAAIAAGKHVYCEKPLAPLATDALEMADAAEAAGIKSQVGIGARDDRGGRVGRDSGLSRPACRRLHGRCEWGFHLSPRSGRRRRAG